MRHKSRRMVKEDLTKSEVSSMISNQFSSKIDSKDFEKKVKEITAKVISDLFKTLWQRDSFWKGNVK